MNTLILMLLQTKGCCCACAVRLLSGRRVALMTLDVLIWRLICPVCSLVICFRVPICTRTNSVWLCCGSVRSAVSSVMARLLLRGSLRGYFTSPLRMGSDQVLKALTPDGHVIPAVWMWMNVWFHLIMILWITREIFISPLCSWSNRMAHELMDIFFLRRIF